MKVVEPLISLILLSCTIPLTAQMAVSQASSCHFVRILLLLLLACISCVLVLHLLSLTFFRPVIGLWTVGRPRGAKNAFVIKNLGAFCPAERCHWPSAYRMADSIDIQSMYFMHDSCDQALAGF